MVVLRLIKIFTCNKIVIISVVVIALVIFTHERKVSAVDFCDSYSRHDMYKVVDVEQISPDQAQIKVRRLGNNFLYLLKVGVMWGDVVPIRNQVYRMSFRDEVPENFDGFAYKDYLLKQGICYLGEVSFHNMELVSDTNSIEKRWVEFEYQLQNSINKSLPDELSGLFFGLILGKDLYFSEEMASNFQDLGLTHLIAVSGANFVLIVTIFSKLISFKRGLFNQVFQIIIASVFMLLVGIYNLAAFRAYIFMLVSIVLKILGIRLGKLAKLVVGLVIIMVSVPHAYADIGFQLSIISWSLLNLIPASGLISRFSMIPELLRDEVLMALFGSCILFPVSLMYFREYNLVSLVANTIIGPLFSLFSLILIGLFPVKLIFSGQIIERLVLSFNSIVVYVYGLIEEFAGIKFVITGDSVLGHFLYMVFFGIILFFIYKKACKYASKECIQQFYI